MTNSNLKKNVLIIAGHDPSGGAGVQADIEAITAAGCRALSIITVLTSQDSRGVNQVWVQDAEQVKQQLKVLLDDITVHACKLGLLGSADIVHMLAETIADLNIPLVLDPVLQSGTGSELASQEVIAAMQSGLFPLTTVITPNSNEARQLTNCEQLDQAASSLLAAGCQSVLITGTHEQSEDVINRLFLDNRETHQYQWPRLPHNYHGSGCTLASALTAQLALEKELVAAIEHAQAYTWHTLEHAEQPGQGQWLPDRLYKQ